MVDVKVNDIANGYIIHVSFIHNYIQFYLLSVNKIEYKDFHKCYDYIYNTIEDLRHVILIENKIVLLNEIRKNNKISNFLKYYLKQPDIDYNYLFDLAIKRLDRYFYG
jgi:hypothetical protein